MPAAARSSASQVLVAVLLVLLAVAGLHPSHSHTAHAISFCKPLPIPEDCQFGLVRDYCGRMVCAKGPGERCGGPSHIQGTCGDGMHCKCEKCIGCSLHTLTCDLNDSICF